MAGALKPSVCIDAVLGGMPYDEALKIVSKAGIGAFEFWGWWDKDIDAVIAARDANELEISACCTKFIASCGCKSDFNSIKLGR